MRSVAIFLLIFLFSFKGNGFTDINDHVGEEVMLFTTNEFFEEWTSRNENLNKLNAKLDKDFERFGRSKKFVKQMFYRAHKYLLDDYQQYASLDNLMEEGRYDCVSGSLLYAMILDRYGFDYQIVETSFHVFLTLTIDNEQILLEATDPFGGFMTDQNEIESYVEDFKKAAHENKLYLDPVHQKRTSLFNPSIYREINLQQLKGLEYYNSAIYYNNNGALTNAFEKVSKASKYYEADRIVAFKELLQTFLTVAKSN